jgi:hypothetical protein
MKTHSNIQKDRNIINLQIQKDVHGSIKLSKNFLKVTGLA